MGIIGGIFEQHVRGVESKVVFGQESWQDGLHLILERKEDFGDGDHEGHQEGSGCTSTHISVFDYDDEDTGEGSGGSTEILSENVWAPPVFEDSKEEDEYESHVETTDSGLADTYPESTDMDGTSESKEIVTNLPKFVDPTNAPEN